MLTTVIVQCCVKTQNLLWHDWTSIAGSGFLNFYDQRQWDKSDEIF